MKIVLAAPLPPPAGGIATWTEGLLAYLKKDAEVVLVDTAVRYGSLGRLRSGTLSASALRLVCGPLAAASILFRFAWALLTRRCHAAHICTSASLGMARDLILVALARLRCANVVLHMHLGWIPAILAKHNWESWLTVRACRLTRCVIVLDDASAASLRAAVPACQVHVVPNPAWRIAVNPPPLGKAHSSTIVFVGHVVPSKGVRELVQACAAIQGESLFLQLLGPIEQEFREELLHLAQVRARGNWLEIAGLVSNRQARDRVRSALALALPSYWEGFPYVVLEAMAESTPVIATPVGAMASMLAANSQVPCGLLVPVGDVESLREAIVRLLHNPNLAHELGRHGCERVLCEYAPHRVVAAYQALWTRTKPIKTNCLAEPSQSAAKPSAGILN